MTQTKKPVPNQRWAQDADHNSRWEHCWVATLTINAPYLARTWHASTLWQKIIGSSAFATQPQHVLALHKESCSLQDTNAVWQCISAPSLSASQVVSPNRIELVNKQLLLPTGEANSNVHKNMHGRDTNKLYAMRQHQTDASMWHHSSNTVICFCCLSSFFPKLPMQKCTRSHSKRLIECMPENPNH